MNAETPMPWLEDDVRDAMREFDPAYAFRTTHRPGGWVAIGDSGGVTVLAYDRPPHITIDGAARCQSFDDPIEAIAHASALAREAAP